jgi:hypothetical protein
MPQVVVGLQTSLGRMPDEIPSENKSLLSICVFVPVGRSAGTMPQIS